jgi:hypothetical protein
LSFFQQNNWGNFDFEKKKKPSVSSISFPFWGKNSLNFQYHKIGFKKNPWLQCAFVIAIK